MDRTEKVDIGLAANVRRDIAQQLFPFFTSTYALYLKTQHAHWNLIGPNFIALHLLFEKHYEEMAAAIDEIAERIRALGHAIDGTLAALQSHTIIRGAQNALIQDLLDGHEALSRLGRPLIRAFQDAHDDVTSDLLIRRLSFHEKAAWMLRSSV